MQLRDYQIEAINNLKTLLKNGAQRPVFGLPTGGGKTVCIAEIVRLSQIKGTRVCFVAHRIEILTQAQNTISAYGIDLDTLHFGMVQTFVRSPHKIPVADLYILDECHVLNYKRFIDLLPNHARVLGLTATPISALAKTPLNQVFTDVSYSFQIHDLIEKGHLSRPEYNIWRIDESRLKKDNKGEFTAASQNAVFSQADLIEAINLRIGKTLIFCASIESAEKIYDLAVSINPESYLVHSKMRPNDRSERVRYFKESKDAIMVNCSILTTGFDCPDIETVIIYRATTSLPLWMQMVGRGARVTENKNRFYIFDLGNNVDRLLTWEMPRDWVNLFKDQGKKQSRKLKEAAKKKCINCQSIIPAATKICPYCGIDQPTNEKAKPKADEIQIIKSFQELPTNLQKPYQQMTIEELIARAAYGSPKLGRPFKASWVVNQLKGRHNALECLTEYARLKGYKPGWVHRQLAHLP